MDLINVLRVFDNNPEYIITKHFELKLIERNFSLDSFHPIHKNKILGIYNQSKDKYKFILEYNTKYDLILILDININGNVVTYITIYKEIIGKRLRIDENKEIT